MPKEKESTEKKPQKGRTVKDKWRLKEWYKIKAPLMFKNAEIGDTPAEESEKLMGRVIEATYNEVSGSGDPGSAHIKLRFRIIGISENHVANTRFIGHEFTSDYLRRLARRKRSKVDLSFQVTTKDGVVFTVKPIAVSEHRLQTKLRAMLRQKIKALMAEEAAKRSASDFVVEMLNGEINKALAKGVSTLYPLRKIDIRASDVEGEIPEGVAPPAAATPESDASPTPEMAEPQAAP